MSKTNGEIDVADLSNGFQQVCKTTKKLAEELGGMDRMVRQAKLEAGERTVESVATAVSRHLLRGQWLTKSDIAEELRLSDKTLDRLRAAGLFPDARFCNGPRLIWTRSQVNAFKHLVESGALNLDQWSYRVARGKLEPIDWDRVEAELVAQEKLNRV